MSWDTWISIVLLALATLVSRSSFFVFCDAVRLPPRLQRALRYAPAAALAAIVAPDLLLVAGPGGSPLGVDVLNPKLLASAGAALLFLFTRSMLGTIVSGMVLYTALRLLWPVA